MFMHAPHCSALTGAPQLCTCGAPWREPELGLSRTRLAVAEASGREQRDAQLGWMRPAPFASRNGARWAHFVRRT